jgi:hypothetical protein
MMTMLITLIVIGWLCYYDDYDDNNERMLMLNADKFEYQNYNTLKMLISKYYYSSPPNLIRC